MSFLRSTSITRDFYLGGHRAPESSGKIIFPEHNGPTGRAPAEAGRRFQGSKRETVTEQSIESMAAAAGSSQRRGFEDDRSVRDHRRTWSGARAREREMTRSGGKDVNAIWAQLKAQNQPSGRREREREEEVSRKETAEVSAPVTSSVVARDAECECFDGFQDVEGAENLLKRTINSLTEGDYLTRRRAIRTLAASLRSCENAELRTDVFVEVVAKHLLRRFEDKSEACRELAVKCIAENVEACKEDAVESLLPYCVPVLGERLGLSGGPDADRRSLIELGAEILQASHVNRVDITDFSRASSKRGQAVEPSEEVRILLIGLLRSLVRHGTHTIKPYAQDFCEILLCCARDPFHEALVESCACLCDLVATLGAKLWMVSKIMLAGYAPVLSHRRQQVRVSAIRAISALVFNGAHESLLDLCSFRDPNGVPVRAVFGDAIKVN